MAGHVLEICINCRNFNLATLTEFWALKNVGIGGL